MAKQRNAYYQLVAQNFLRNISLDGSHQDTALKIFHEKGLQTPFASGVPSTIRSENLNGINRDHPPHHHGKRNSSSSKHLPPRRKSDARRSPSSRSKSHRRFDRLWSSGGDQSSHGESGGILAKLSSKLGGSSEEPHRPKINWNIPIPSATSEESMTRASVLSPKGELKIVFPNIKDVNLTEGRVCICSQQIPAVIFSIIPYKIQPADKEAAIDARSAVSFEDVGLKPFNLKADEEISYSPLLVPSRSVSTLYTSSVTSSMESTSQLSCPVNSNNVKSISTEILMTGGDNDSNVLNRSFQYDANLLDNSEFGAGKHKATLTFTSFVSSIIDYVDPNDLKKEVNEKFKKRFPELRLSYSKYRSLKSEMKEIASTVNMDLLTLAQAYVYFDKIVLKAFINKSNRKYLAGVSLILAAKMNDVKGVDLKTLIQKVEETFRVTRKDLFEYELPAVVALEFTLHVPVNEISSQYQKLLQSS